MVLLILMALGWEEVPITAFHLAEGFLIETNCFQFHHFVYKFNALMPARYMMAQEDIYQF